MATDEFLCSGQAQPGAVGVARDEGIEHGVLQRGRNAGAVILDLDAGDDAVANVADREIGDRPAAQRDRALAVERRGGVAHEIEEGLHHLVAIELDERQPRIVVTHDVQRPPVFRLDDANDILDQLVYVQRLLVRRAARTQQGIDETGETIRLADHDVGVFGEFRVLQLARQ